MSFYPTQVASSVPFDNTENNYQADNVQDAINETIERARYALISAYNANAGTGRWLEWFPGNDTDDQPFVMPRRSIITSLVLTSRGINTCTISIYRNNVVVQTISLASEDSKTIKNLNIIFNVNDELSAQVTAGSIQRPTLFKLLQLDD